MDGVPVKVLNGEYIVPGVTLRLHFRHERALDALRPDGGVDPKEANKLLVAFALDILRRNYPEITEDELIDAAGMADIGAIIGAGLSQSGYSKRPLDQASQPPSASPEATSSAGSSTPPAGASTTSSNSPGPT